jgi:hypothetical protein
MARRTWNLLSANYRRRLERAGINRQRYDAGESLSKARGHAKTPERPERALKRPDRYPEYIRKRTRTGPSDTKRGIRDRVRVKFHGELLPWLEGQFMPEIRRPTWNPNTERTDVRLSGARNPETGELWNYDAMRRFLSMDFADFNDIPWTDLDWSFLWYH